MHTDTPSEWIVRWSHLVPAGAAVLDVASGGGRHLRWFAARGARTTGVDRAPEAMAAASLVGEGLLADLEAAPWPLAGRVFDAVLVTNYLHRPLMPLLAASLAPGGVLMYETFAAGQETVGRPSRAEFLLQPGELLAAFAGLFVVAYQDGWLPGPRRVQRIVVRRAPDDGSPPAPHLTDTPP